MNLLLRRFQGELVRKEGSYGGPKTSRLEEGLGVGGPVDGGPQSLEDGTP